MKPHFILIAFLGATLFASTTSAQSLNTRREIEKANKETLPGGAKTIEESTTAKVEFTVDAASYGDDEKAWANLDVIVNRIVGAIVEVGKDQIGKDAITKGVKKIVVMKSGGDAKDDAADLKGGTLTVKTAGNDQSAYTLQGVVSKALEKAL